MLLDHRRFLAGDPLTVRLFYSASRQWVRRYFNNPAVIASVIQQALLEMTTRLRGGEEPEPERLVYWIYACTNNAVRRQQTRQRRHEADAYQSGIHGHATIDIGLAAELRQELEHLERTLERSGDKARKLIEGRVRGMTYRELAKQCDMREGTARQSVCRLREQLVGELSARDKADYLMRQARIAGLESPPSDETSAS